MGTPAIDGGTSRTGGRRLRSGLMAAGAAFGMTLGGFAFAAAQTETPPADPPPAEREAAPRPHKNHGRHGRLMGIHGEFTTRAPGGGYQTLATQLGEVTEVSRSSITVRSEDGYSRRYSVDDNTLVNAGNDGIADVKQGDQVHVTAVVADGNARAVDVKDSTQMRALRDRWAPPRD